MEQQGYTHLFPVQSQTLAHIQAGNDVIVKARTGTGKTLGFTLPIIESLRVAPKYVINQITFSSQLHFI
jgi:superfamily II DNA/RNA helicase